MVQEITEYKCEVCGEIFPKYEHAVTCESTPQTLPKFSVGDTVYIALYAEASDFAKDTILEIKQVGHVNVYVTNGFYGDDRDDLRNYLDDYTIELLQDYFIDGEYPFFISTEPPPEKYSVLAPVKNTQYQVYT